MSRFAGKISYLTGLIQKHGVFGLVMKYVEKKTEKTDRYYRVHFKEFLADEAELERQKKDWKSFSYCPKISIVVPTYRTPESFLIELLESVLGQSYGNWELCLADGSCDGGASVGKIAAEYAKRDSRIVYKALPKNGGISLNTNAGVGMASGEYIALLDHDDLLAKNALYEMVSEINRRKVRPLFLYSDEDKVDETGQMHYEPHFKTEYNEELLNHYNFICHFVLFSKELLDIVGGLNSAFDGAQDYDFVLRCSENLKKQQIAHVGKIVYHWRVHGLSTAGFSGNKDYAYEAGIRAVQAHLDRVTEKLLPDAKSVKITAQPAKGREYIWLQRTCEPEELNLLMEDWVICLGKDVRPVDGDWAKKLILDAYGHTEPVGMIGGKLITSKGIRGRVCSVGYHFLKDGRIISNFEGISSNRKGYFRRAVVPQNVSACSLDFCVIQKRVLEQVGGFEEGLPRPYRDLDFAFRLRDAGYQVLLDARVVACQKQVFRENESARMRLLERWAAYFEEGDPFYNESIRGNGNI
ncbi:MAG: glycosyltransferase [Agathobacter sp.]